jgi:hypothetical protein
MLSAAAKQAERLRPIGAQLEKMLSASAVARRLDRCPAWISQAIRDGRIKPDCVAGKSFLFREGHVSKLMEQFRDGPRLSEVMKRAMPPEGVFNRLAQQRRTQIRANIEANAPAQEDSK